MIAAALVRAAQLGIPYTVVVDDSAGNVKAMVRMDGASLFGINCAPHALHDPAVAVGDRIAPATASTAY